MYERYCKLKELKGLKDSDVARGTGISKYVLSDWKRGKSVPKADKLQKIADFMGVSVEYLIKGETQMENNYFLDEEAALMAQRMHDDENIRILFDGVQKISKEDLQFVVDLVKRMDKENG